MLAAARLQLRAEEQDPAACVLQHYPDARALKVVAELLFET
jgi:hypothetical protein